MIECNPAHRAGLLDTEIGQYEMLKIDNHKNRIIITLNKV